MAATGQMDALMVTEIGKPLVCGRREIPQPGEGEVQVKVQVVGLNPYDHRVRDWGLYTNGILPMVTGNDIVGTIDAFGPSSHSSTTNPQNLQPGDQILGQTNYLKTTPDQAGLQQYCLLDAAFMTRVPPSLSSTPAAAATIPNNLLAPFIALFGTEGLNLPAPFPSTSSYWQSPPGTLQKQTQSTTGFTYSKETLLIIGASGNCGKYGVQCARLAGFGRIIAVASPPHAEELRSYGATHVLDRHAADVEDQVRQIVCDELIYGLDCINLDHSLALSCLSNHRKGKLTTLVPGQIPVQASATEKKQAGWEDRFSQGCGQKQPELGRAFWECLGGWVEEGRIKPLKRGEVIKGLDEAARKRVDEVYDLYRDGGCPVGGQVHVHVS
ncbi:MAG: hypothetical protein M1817_000807 [Caeruleum heppii]|nr:MAG: hypothetical protein M1817_000807 [Caeruleum heppii]